LGKKKRVAALMSFAGEKYRMVDFMSYMSYMKKRRSEYRTVWIVEYYETEKKFYPVKAFIDSLPTMKMQAKALRDIGLLESLGTEIREPFFD